MLAPFPFNAFRFLRSAVTNAFIFKTILHPVQGCQIDKFLKRNFNAFCTALADQNLIIPAPGSIDLVGAAEIFHHRLDYSRQRTSLLFNFTRGNSGQFDTK